jgi:hypothetical protein
MMAEAEGILKTVSSRAMLAVSILSIFSKVVFIPLFLSLAFLSSFPFLTGYAPVVQVAA